MNTQQARIIGISFMDDKGNPQGRFLFQDWCSILDAKAAADKCSKLTGNPTIIEYR